MPEKQPKVYAAIAAVAADLAAQGIAKDQVNQGQHYNFRGIDDVLNALAPLLTKHKLLILPRMISRECAEHTTGKGTVMFKATVHGEFDFVAVEDSSKHTVAMYGEAMDTGDKATNKAMSAAYKYAAFQAFCIPVDVEDADAVTPPPVKPSELAFPPEEVDPRGREPEEEIPTDAAEYAQQVDKKIMAGTGSAKPAPPSQCISDKQRKMLFAVLYIGLPDPKAKTAAVEAMKAMLFSEGIDHTDQIPKAKFNAILGRLPECNAKCKARVEELAKEKRK